jgi:putative ABC transport system permease protein
MLKSYFLIAWRGLKKNRVFSVINIAGLAIGLGVCLLIALYVANELSYDRFNEKADRIYRLDADIRMGDMFYNNWDSPPPVGPVLATDCPDIESVVRIDCYVTKMLVRNGDQTIQEDHAAWADSTLFAIFTMPLLAGDPKTALVEPNSMVISEKMAKKYFGSVADAIGRSMLTDNSLTFKITGVYRDMPVASHLHFDFIRSFSTNSWSRMKEWLNNGVATYVLLRPGVTKAMLERDLRGMVLKYIQPDLEGSIHASIADLEKKGGHFRYVPMELTKIHLYSDLTTELEPSGNVQYVYIFIAAGVLILLLACVNFMNLSTSRSAGRAREVGVRKVLGSRRGQLVGQFLIESFLMAALALGLGLLLASVALPYFNAMAGTALSWRVLPWVWVAPELIGLMAAVGALAGSYPAFYLSAFKPVKVLKARLGTDLRGLWFRNGLVVFQFTVAVILIIGTLTIYSQLRFMQNKKLGYNREEVALIPNMGSLSAHARDFEEQILRVPGVVSATMASKFPTSIDWNINSFCRDASMTQSQSLNLARWNVDATYIPTMGMEMAVGRNFSPLMPTDSNAVIINETAARVLGYKDLLKHSLYEQDNPQAKVNAMPIIGVVKDFSTGSLRNKIQPLVFKLRNELDQLAIRVKTNDLTRLMAAVEAKYHAATAEMAGQPFSYTFMDEDFNRLYVGEQRTGKLLLSFAGFAILIACLGLFGLVRFAAERRTREIGIRKVLGASELGLVRLLSKDLVGLVVVAVVLASPAAWWLGHWWLQGFAYQVTLNVWIFVLAAGSAVAIAMVTVGVQAVRAARANPVVSLRSE